MRRALGVRHFDEGVTRRAFEAVPGAIVAEVSHDRLTPEELGRLQLEVAGAQHHDALRHEPPDAVAAHRRQEARRRLEQLFSGFERIDIVKTMWRLVYSDGKLTDYEGYLVRKDLAQQFRGQYPVPTYVGEFLLGRYCATTDPDEIAPQVDGERYQIAVMLQSTPLHALEDLA